MAQHMAQKQETFILSLGGSLIYPSGIDVPYLKRFRELILKLVASGKRFGIVCGGGAICRTYIQKANEVVQLKPIQNDIVGIATTRVNAQLVREIFGDAAHENVIIDYSKKISTSNAIVIGAGWLPGCSTDKDTVLLAEKYGAQTVVNLTNVDYVYDKDPRKYTDARPLHTLTWKQFKNLVGGEWKAGMNLPFDPVASQLAMEKKLRVVILNGKNLENLTAFLEGKKFVGTIIA